MELKNLKTGSTFKIQRSFYAKTNPQEEDFSLFYNKPGSIIIFVGMKQSDIFSKYINPIKKFKSYNELYFLSKGQIFYQNEDSFKRRFKEKYFTPINLEQFL